MLRRNFLKFPALTLLPLPTTLLIKSDKEIFLDYLKSNVGKKCVIAGDSVWPTSVYQTIGTRFREEIPTLIFEDYAGKQKSVDFKIVPQYNEEGISFKDEEGEFNLTWGTSTEVDKKKVFVNGIEVKRVTLNIYIKVVVNESIPKLDPV